MRRIAFCLLAVFFGQCALVAGDVRLDKPVTLAVKGEALSDIMPLIEKQTGVRVKAAQDIADQKATIFVDGKPLKEIMTGLQTVFGYTWSYSDFKGARSYTLSMPGRFRREREDWRKKAFNEAWKDFDSELKRTAEMPVKSRQELDRLFDQTEPEDDPFPGVYKVNGYDSERRKKAAARLYLTLSSSLRKDLQDGMTVCWSLDSPEPEWKIPAALEREFREGTIFYDVELNFPDKRVKKDFGTLTCELTAISTPDKFRVEVYEHLGRTGDTMNYVFNVYEKSLSKFMPPAKAPLPKAGDDSLLNSKVSYTAEELAKEAALPDFHEPWDTATYINRSDLLALLHKKLGFQIISDHYSHWYQWSPADKLSVRSILESFELYPGYPGGPSAALKYAAGLQEDWYVIQRAEDYPASAWGWDGKVLYMRAANPDRMDSREIPNRLLLRWQAVSQEGLLGLNEMGEIRTLTEPQLQMLAVNFRRFRIEMWRDSIEAKSPALRLYGLLTPRQRQMMLDGRLSIRGFNAEQMSALRSLMPSRTSDTRTRQGGYRVGVYDEAGFRIDKPDIGSSTFPESVHLESKRQIEGFVVDNRPMAKSLEEILQVVKTDWERAALRKFVGTEYEMAFAYEDGTETTKSFSILTYKPMKLPSGPDGNDEKQKDQP